MMLHAKTFLTGVILGLLLPVAAAATIKSDICIFGGTSAGVIAAVQAANMGKTVVVVEPGSHLGGLTAGGLGWTDTGNKAAIGGLAREFYRRLGRHYGKTEAWTFEPSVAEHEFNAMLKQARVPVYFQQHLVTVTKSGTRIVKIAMQKGDVFHAKMFIDATYEGDLMAKAGVTYFVGREANYVYGETLDGIRGNTPKHQFTVPVDPYVKPGDLASGLLPLIQPVAFGSPGDGDQSVQAYNLRLCLTKNFTNRIPIEPPANYDPGKYALLGRYFDALATAHRSVTLKDFLKIDMVTPDKTDVNNNGPFSTDAIGMNDDYPNASYKERERIYAGILDYTKGLLTYLATSPHVPASVRSEMQQWGLCKDEFVDNGGWPHQLYVREARRLVSDYVMTENNCRRKAVAMDSIGLAAYNMDSHNCRRLVRGGHVENEGDVEVAPMSPYPISYRAIVPKPAQCENLLVPVCLSASHIAYGSIRMEPVFMLLGQSAATAAAVAIDNSVPVQKVSYAKLRDQLLADDQILDWPASASKSNRP